MMDTGDGPANAIEASVVSGSVTTLYPNIPDLLGVTSTALLVVAAAVGLLRKRRSMVDRPVG